MNLEQTVLDTLRTLPSKKQEEVLVFIQSLQQELKPDPALQQVVRQYFVSKILPDLQRIHRDPDEPPSPVYADSLIRTIREVRDLAPSDHFTKILLALHDAMAFQNRWATYTEAQYDAAYNLLSGLVDLQSLSSEDVQKTTRSLEAIGFDTMPFEVSVSLNAKWVLKVDICFIWDVKEKIQMVQVVISPQSLLETGIRVEKIDDIRLFKFTDDLQTRLEDLLEKNKTGSLTLEEETELNGIGELDRIFTYLNSLLVAQQWRLMKLQGNTFGNDRNLDASIVILLKKLAPLGLLLTIFSLVRWVGLMMSRI
jgi:hypothetical protein